MLIIGLMGSSLWQYQLLFVNRSHCSFLIGMVSSKLQFTAQSVTCYWAIHGCGPWSSDISHNRRKNNMYWAARSKWQYSSLQQNQRYEFTSPLLQIIHKQLSNIKLSSQCSELMAIKIGHLYSL